MEGWRRRPGNGCRSSSRRRQRQPSGCASNTRSACNSELLDLFAPSQLLTPSAAQSWRCRGSGACTMCRSGEKRNARACAPVHIATCFSTCPGEVWFSTPVHRPWLLVWGFGVWEGHLYCTPCRECGWPLCARVKGGYRAIRSLRVVCDLWSFGFWRYRRSRFRQAADDQATRQATSDQQRAAPTSKRAGAQCRSCLVGREIQFGICS